MKKFISALTSLVIATTALGGMALSSNAEINGSVDKTIIDIRSGSGNTVEANAGESVPVAVYVPQSSGIHTIALKLSINNNGDPTQTLGMGVEEDAARLQQIHESLQKVGAEWESVEHYIFGNFGITMTNARYPDYSEGDDDAYCFDSGYLNNNTMYAGWSGNASSSIQPSVFNITWQHAGAVQKDVNMDSFNAWNAAGQPAYANWTPVYTWTTADSEDWAYDFPLATFDLQLPADLEDGIYTVDYVADFINLATDLWGHTTVVGVEGTQAFEVIPLTIKVGDAVETTKASESSASETTTTAEQTTAPSSSSSNQGGETATKPTPPADTVQYDLIPAGGDYTFDGVDNVYKAQPGEELTVNWVVSNDPGTAGLMMTFNFDDLENYYVSYSGSRTYPGNSEFNDNSNSGSDKKWVYTYANNVETAAKDGSTILSFTFQLPEDASGTYWIGEEANPPAQRNEARRLETELPFVFYGLKIVVGDEEQTTSTTTETEPSQTTTTTASASSASSAETTTTTASSSSNQPQPGDIVWGDTNCDGFVTISDVILLNKYIAKNTDAVTDQGKLNANCEYDDTLDSKDSLKIKQYLAHLIPYTDLGNQ